MTVTIQRFLARSRLYSKTVTPLALQRWLHNRLPPEATYNSTRRGVNLDNISMWDFRLDTEVDIEQSIKKGFPVPKITADLIRWHSVLGRRHTNEDRVIATELADNILLLGIFDGHGGSLAADFVSQRLPQHISLWLRHTNSLHTALSQSFIEINNLFSRHLALNHKEGDGSALCGTTATVLLLRNSLELAIASLGDSRAILCRRGVARMISFNHLPDVDTERKRIEARNGFVCSNSFGQTLVNARLSMTRSIGDTELKRFGVMPVPDLIGFEVKPHRDSFIVLTTDGVNNVMNNQEVVNIVLHCQDPEESCHLLCDISLQYGSDDNATVAILPLGAWAKDFQPRPSLNPFRGYTPQD